MRLGRLLAVLPLLPLLWPPLFTGCGGPRKRALSPLPRRATQRNPYDVLGLAGGASYDDIRAAFRKLARMYHPDVPGTGDEDRFRSIREALEELGTSAGRARWSTPNGGGSGYRATYSSYDTYGSYTSDFRGYAYNYDTRAQREPKRREDEREYARERRGPNRKRKEEAKKKAKGPGGSTGSQDFIMEKELKKAVKEAEFRQAQRKKEWWLSMKEAKESLKKEVKQDMQMAWKVVNRFQETRREFSREKVDKWKVKLEETHSASANRRKEAGESWVQKFAEVKQQAADGREELGRRFAEKWRDFRADAQSVKKEVASPEKINEEIEALLQQQDERISERWSEMYKGMMKSVQRSMHNEPKHWKDRFRTAMIKCGRGGEHVQQRWMTLFQDTMKDMGEREMKQVSQWVADFKAERPWTDKEMASREKLMKASRKLKSADFSNQQHILKTIDRCHKAEIQRLKWQEWDRRQYMRKFRQEQDRLWKSQQEEELRMTDEFWKAVKEHELQKDVTQEPKWR